MSSARNLSRSARIRGSGRSMAEYALCMVLVALATLATTQMVGCRLNNAFNKVAETMSRAF